MALAEQLETTVQTNEQESRVCEDALQGVGQVLRPATDVELCLEAPDFGPVTWAFLQHISGILVNASPISHSSLPPPVTPLAANPASLLCTYRI